MKLNVIHEYMIPLYLTSFIFLYRVLKFSSGSFRFLIYTFFFLNTILHGIFSSIIVSVMFIYKASNVHIYSFCNPPPYRILFPRAFCVHSHIICNNLLPPFPVFLHLISFSYLLHQLVFSEQH